MTAQDQVGGEGPLLGPAHFRMHAGQIEALRSRVGLVRVTLQHSGRGVAVFGKHCGRFVEVLGPRYEAYDELSAYLEENLAIVIRGMRQPLRDDQELARWVDLRPDQVDLHEPWLDLQKTFPPHDGTREALIEDLRELQWVEPRLTYGAATLDFAQPVDEPVVRLRAVALDSAIAGIGPLRQLLDDLGGSPQVIANRATCWHAVANELHRLSADLRSCINRDFPATNSPGVQAYRTLMAANVAGLYSHGSTARVMAVILDTARELITLTVDVVRSLIADFCARIVIGLADHEVVPLAVTAAGLAATVWRVCSCIDDLELSLDALSGYLSSED